MIVTIVSTEAIEPCTGNLSSTTPLSAGSGVLAANSPEVLVERQTNSLFSDCQCQYIGVRDAWEILPYPDNVMGIAAKRIDEATRNILVAQATHRHAAVG